MQANVLYYGDNLDILRRSLPDACIDLLYRLEGELIHEILILS